MSDSKAEIRRLVKQFSQQRESYVHDSYKEAQLRQEFIDPMWKALGWDMQNERGYAEQYKEVIHEDAIKISADAYTKAPDYCFRIGGIRKFFLEAKKPSVDVKNDPAPAFQLRRYAWSAKLPLSVLTDFEELAVYDTRIKPAASDKASTARTMLIPFTEFVDRWDEIAAIFSRDAILTGSFEKYAESAKKKRGTASVDAAFLKEIEKWRDELARNIAVRNTDVSQPELNFAVQVIIDRIVFLRICEDRGIEEYATLLGTSNGANIYQRLIEQFRLADRKYNSGLFHFSEERGRNAAPDSLTPHLEVDDAILKRILRTLYYPDSPYEFSVLPADILGQVYEQFLGKVIRLTAGHQAKVEEKPEVKKAGGVYYTPTYVVDYIVRHTIGPLLEGKLPKQIAGRQSVVRILDPACGSGTFLLQAYQYLMDWHRDAYVKDGVKKHSTGRDPTLFEATGGEWRLTTSERKRILLDHIFGVDIDHQAAEVTKLSLLLKVLEGESDQTLQRTFRLFQKRALPDLDGNIKSGNTLIGPDLLRGLGIVTEDDDVRDRLRPFDWKEEFPDVFSGRQPGFHVILGNPPYNKISGREDAFLLALLKREYRTAAYKTEMYSVFAEKSLRLLRQGGRHGFVIPNSFLAGVHLVALRKILAEENTLEEAVLLKDVKVFAKAKLDSVVYIVEKGQPRANSSFLLRVAGQDFLSGSDKAQKVTLKAWKQTTERHFRITAGELSPEVEGALERDSIPLRDVASVHLGLILASNDLLKETRSRSAPNPILLGRDIGRYSLIVPKHWFSYSNDQIVGGTKKLSVYEAGPRLVFQAIRNLKLPQRLVGTMVDGGVFTMGTLHNLIVHRTGIPPEYLLGVLNSALMNSFYAGRFPEHRIKGAYLEQLPIRLANKDKPEEMIWQKIIVENVKARLDLSRGLMSARVPQEVRNVQKKATELERAIDIAVFHLYGLVDFARAMKRADTDTVSEVSASR